MRKLFGNNTPVISIPTELVRLLFIILESGNENKHGSLFEFGKWLNAMSHRDAEVAVDITEIYLSYVKNTKSYLYDRDNDFTQLMTRLFAEAGEREESDNGEMVKC